MKVGWTIAGAVGLMTATFALAAASWLAERPYRGSALRSNAFELGRVSAARVKGMFAGTPTGACVQRAVKSARFPKSRGSLSITYPFMLR